jgi:hypothetical protein
VLSYQPVPASGLFFRGAFAASDRTRVLSAGRMGVLLPLQRLYRMLPVASSCRIIAGPLSVHQAASEPQETSPAKRSNIETSRNADRDPKLVKEAMAVV